MDGGGVRGVRVGTELGMRAPGRVREVGATIRPQRWRVRARLGEGRRPIIRGTMRCTPPQFRPYLRTMVEWDECRSE